MPQTPFLLALLRKGLTLAVCAAALIPAGAALAIDARIVTLPTNDLIYDPVHDLIYASVPSSAGARGNTVTTINPATGEILSSVFVGSEPSTLALSGDGQSLYVALDGAAAVRRVDVVAGTAGLQFPLGTSTSDVMPGYPDTIAVSLKNRGFSPRHEGVAIYDNGVRRSLMTQGHTGSNRIEFSASGNLLFGYNNETTEFGLRKIAVTNDGATQTTVVQNVISGFGTDIEFDNGVIYATTGAAVDAAALSLIGTYGASGPVRVDSARGLVYVLQNNAIKTFNQGTYTLASTDAVQGVSGTAGNLIRTGTDKVAFRTSGGQVFLVTLGNSIGGLRVPNVLDSSQTAAQSFLRFYNTGATAGTVDVTLAAADDGRAQATWTSPAIPPNASRQFDLATIEAGATGGAIDRHGMFTLAVKPHFNGYFQHVVWRAGDGTLTNLTACDARLTSDPTQLMNVHSSALPAYPAAVTIYNTGTAPATLSLGIYDAATGVRLGVYSTGSIPANSQISRTIAQMEAAARVTPTATQYHYNLKFQNPSTFTGMMQYLVNNTAVNIATDMTGACPLLAQ